MKEVQEMSSNQPYPPDPRMQGNQQPPNQGNQVPNEGYPYRAASDARSVNAGGAYSESQRESYVDPAGNRIESEAQVFEDVNQSRANIRYWITTIVYFVLAVLEVILALRFLFRLLGANEGSGFVAFLYGLSHVFVAPFNGIFNDQTIGNVSVFEVSTLIAMVLYALIAWGLVSLGKVMFGPNLTGHQSVTTTRRSRF
jgi:YGGT family